MILGSGNIAKVLEDRDDLVFFACGVSDSSCTDKAEFLREVERLHSIDKESHVVYFSNLGVYRWDSPYIQHKRDMEEYVKSWFKYYTIVRVEVIRWGKNTNTIHNYFRKCIENNIPVTIQNTNRYVLDIEEFKYWIGLIKYGVSGEMNIPGRKMHVCEIYKEVLEGRL